MSNPQEVSPEVKDRIFDSVLAELVASGIDSFRVEAVARRAGVETAVISARWHDSRVLLMDAILTRAAKLSPSPDTGSLTGDLAALTASMSEFSASDLGRQWIHRLLPNGRDADLSEVGTDFWAARFGSFEPILQRAFKNDELRVGVDPREAIRMFASALNYDVIFTDGRPTTPSFAETLKPASARGPCCVRPPMRCSIRRRCWRRCATTTGTSPISLSARSTPPRVSISISVARTFWVPASARSCQESKARAFFPAWRTA